MGGQALDTGSKEAIHSTLLQCLPSKEEICHLLLWKGPWARPPPTGSLPPGTWMTPTSPLLLREATLPPCCGWCQAAKVLFCSAGGGVLGRHSCDDSEDVFSHKGTEQAGGVSKCGPLSVTAAPAPGLVKG